MTTVTMIITERERMTRRWEVKTIKKKKKKKKKTSMGGFTRVS